MKVHTTGWHASVAKSWRSRGALARHATKATPKPMDSIALDDVAPMAITTKPPSCTRSRTGSRPFLPRGASSSATLLIIPVYVQPAASFDSAVTLDSSRS